MTSSNALKQVNIETNSRLHLGFISLNSSTPYTYGGVGLTISGHPTKVNIKKYKQFESNLPKDITKKILTFLKKNHLSTLIRIECQYRPENHIGLGTGTQLALLIEELITKFYALKVKANIFNRRFRSGIGLNSYVKGGFIIDAPKKDLSLNQTIFHSKFPQSWKAILLFDNQKKGLHGESEKKFFANNSSHNLRMKLSDIILNELIPSIIYEDFNIFAKSLTKFQKLNATFYSKVQKSIYLSNDINKIIKKISKKFIVGCGQSSWGPTSYIFVNSKNDLNEILPILDKSISMYNNLSYEVVSAKNNGRKLTYT
jgi:beta-RFAP synthase